MRIAVKIDVNQPEIVKALRQVGWFAGDTNAIIINGVILICLFLSSILDAVNKLNK